MIYNEELENNHVLRNVKREYCGKDEDDKRYLHTLGVVEKALELNKVHHVYIEQQKVIDAAGYHDIAKFLPKNEMLDRIKKEFPDLFDGLIEYPFIWHSFAGKVYVKEKYHIIDMDVLNTICYHTTGRPNMSILEKIIFISDFIEERTRKGEYLEGVREMAKHNINQTILEILRLKVEYINQKKDKVYELTNKTYQYYLGEV